jgi:GntR family transcriptional regulator
MQLRKEAGFLIILDLQSRVPIYEQLKNKIYELATIGQLKPGDQLPSVRNFARDLGVNPNTVQKAYQDLERDGIISSITGKGSFLNNQLQLNEVIEREYLQKIGRLAAQAKQCGVKMEEITKTIKKVYEEGEN